MQAPQTALSDTGDDRNMHGMFAILTIGGLQGTACILHIEFMCAQLLKRQFARFDKPQGNRNRFGAAGPKRP